MDGTILTAILAVLTEVARWIVSAVEILVAIFYANGELTVIGTLAVIGVAVALCMLVFMVIRKFMSFR